MSLKNTDCTLGIVVALDQKTLPLQRGHIAGPVTTHPSAGEVVVVEWKNGTLQKVTLRSLILEEEANRIEAELQLAKDKLEAEFEKTAEEVGKKLIAAAKLVREAAVIADKAGSDLTTDFYDATHELERAMDQAGWSTSSWHC
jgi:hypothetical protein